MRCSICSIQNKALREEIEQYLLINDGFLSEANKTLLKDKYPNEVNTIEAITTNDCTLHFNFHIVEARVSSLTSAPAKEGQEAKNASLAEDVGKDEAQILSELANTQMATFNLLTKRINTALQDADTEASTAAIHPTLIQLYRETADSVRSSVKSIQELNSSINGSADSALEGLKALAKALHPAESKDSGKPATDGTTDMFD